MTNTSGKVFINGIPYNRKYMRREIAFVQQDDLFMPSLTLTVRDHLLFCALMKLPKELSLEMKRAKVSNIIRDAGLTLVADLALCLVSGGERKVCL